MCCRRKHGYDGNGVLSGISHTTGAQVRWMKMAASKPSFTDDTMGYPWDIRISAGEIHPFAQFLGFRNGRLIKWWKSTAQISRRAFSLRNPTVSDKMGHHGMLHHGYPSPFQRYAEWPEEKGRADSAAEVRLKEMLFRYYPNRMS